MDLAPELRRVADSIGEHDRKTFDLLTAAAEEITALEDALLLFLNISDRIWPLSIATLPPALRSFANDLRERRDGNRNVWTG